MPPLPLVLIVDDEKICRTIVSSMVEKIGLPTMTAGDGLEAVDIFTQHRQEICCILMDLQMPSMNGVDACRRIREMDADMPVVFASGYLDADNRKLLDPLNPMGYLKKPIGYSELSELLSRILTVIPRPDGGAETPDNACGHSRDRCCG